LTVNELLSAWDAEIEAALRHAEDALPAAREAVLQAEEKVAAHDDLARQVVKALAGHDPMPHALAIRLEDLQSASRSDLGLVCLRKQEVASRNVAAIVKPPKVEATEVAIMTAEQVKAVLDTLRSPPVRPGQNSEPEPHPLHAIVATAIGTGMRRGELCALAWGAVDLDAATLRVERSLEEIKQGLRFKPPKTKNGRRTISLPANVLQILREHRRRQAEQRLLFGLGRPGADDLVFTVADGAPCSPDNLSRDWRRTVLALDLPRVMFHALRHSHASALIAAGLDVLTISRRLGHGSAGFTLKTYGHLFADKADAAARAIDAAMGGGNATAKA
jgi:integrase